MRYITDLHLHQTQYARACFPRCNSYGWPIAAHDGTSIIREYADLRVNRSYLEHMADELVARADIAHSKDVPTPREVEWGKSSISKHSRDAEAAVSKGMYNLHRIKKKKLKKTKRVMSDDEEDFEDAILRLREEAVCGNFRDNIMFE